MGSDVLIFHAKTRMTAIPNLDCLAEFTYRCDITFIEQISDFFHYLLMALRTFEVLQRFIIGQKHRVAIWP